MGIYINPDNITKERWLIEYGLPCPAYEALIYATEKRNLVPVCIVLNPLFSAAAVCDSEGEYRAFTKPTDYRPRRWFLVPRSELTADVVGAAYAKELQL